MSEITPNEARHIASLHADMAFALDCTEEQLEGKIGECCRTYGILATQEALSKAIALGVKVQFPEPPEDREARILAQATENSRLIAARNAGTPFVTTEDVAERMKAILTIGTSHMGENALAAFRYQMTNYGQGYLYQDVPRHRGPFYTRATYSKRGNKRGNKRK